MPRTQPHRVDTNKPFRIRRVKVGKVALTGAALRRVHQTAIGNVHGREAVVIEGIWRLAAEHVHVAARELEVHLAVEPLLALVDGGHDELGLGREPKAVVEDLGEADGEHVAQAADLAVHDNAFNVEVGGAQDSAGGGLVDAARLDADEAVLDNVNAANALAAGEVVHIVEQLNSGVLD